jgi:hypothetical protein
MKFKDWLRRIIGSFLLALILAPFLLYVVKPWLGL